MDKELIKNKVVHWTDLNYNIFWKYEGNNYVEVFGYCLFDFVRIKEKFYEKIAYIKNNDGCWIMTIYNNNPNFPITAIQDYETILILD